LGGKKTNKTIDMAAMQGTAFQVAANHQSMWIRALRHVFFKRHTAPEQALRHLLISFASKVRLKLVLIY
jgi:hypothetical protein